VGAAARHADRRRRAAAGPARRRAARAGLRRRPLHAGVGQRGNPVAETTLDAIPAALLQVTLEAMAAHEIGHCQRHRNGAFASLPGGLADKPDAIEARQPTAELQAIAREMRVTRREEAYADLVGLAWTHARHADQFAQVLAWFDAARADETEHGFHDTRHWLALAHAPDAFDDAATPFEQAGALWQRGLLDD